jgi:hypothetical protein
MPKPDYVVLNNDYVKDGKRWFAGDAGYELTLIQACAIAGALNTGALNPNQLWWRTTGFRSSEGYSVVEA